MLKHPTLDQLHALGVDNPWRVVGWTTMQAQVEVLKSDIKSFTVADAQGKDDKQISDINAFVSSGNCDALIVSPNPRRR